MSEWGPHPEKKLSPSPCSQPHSLCRKFYLFFTMCSGGYPGFQPIRRGLGSQERESILVQPYPSWQSFLMTFLITKAMFVVARLGNSEKNHEDRNCPYPTLLTKTVWPAHLTLGVGRLSFSPVFHFCLTFSASQSLVGSLATGYARWLFSKLPAPRILFWCMWSGEGLWWTCLGSRAGPGGQRGQASNWKERMAKSQGYSGWAVQAFSQYFVTLKNTKKKNGS